jgi:hypothetical protein
MLLLLMMRICAWPWHCCNSRPLLQLLHSGLVLQLQLLLQSRLQLLQLLLHSRVVLVLLLHSRLVRGLLPLLLSPHNVPHIERDVLTTRAEHECVWLCLQHLVK